MWHAFSFHHPLSTSRNCCLGHALRKCIYRLAACLAVCNDGSRKPQIPGKLKYLGDFTHRQSATAQATNGNASPGHYCARGIHSLQADPYPNRSASASQLHALICFKKLPCSSRLSWSANLNVKAVKISRCMTSCALVVDWRKRACGKCLL